MKKYLFPAIAVLMILTVILSTQAQPAAGQAGQGRGAAAGGGMGGGRGGGMGGGRGMTGPVQRPDKAARLASIEEIEKQIAALRATIQKAPATDPNISSLEGEKQETFMAQYTEENDAINQIVQTINTLRPTAGGRGGRGGRGGTAGGLTAEVITELVDLAKQDKAPKLVTRLEALAKEVEAAGARGGGMMGGGRGGGFTLPEGGFQYED